MKVVDFLAQVRVELSKVIWPSPNQTLKLTIIVIVITLTVGFFVGGIDYSLTFLLDRILAR